MNVIALTTTALGVTAVAIYVLKRRPGRASVQFADDRQDDVALLVEQRDLTRAPFIDRFLFSPTPGFEALRLIASAAPTVLGLAVLWALLQRAS